MKLLYLYASLIIIIFLQSCSSIYYPSKIRNANNTFRIQSNVPNYQISYSKIGNSSPLKLNDNSFRINNLSRKSKFIRVTSTDYNDVNIELKRIPRLGAVMINIPSIMLYGIPLIVDLFRSDFYKLSPYGKTINVKFLRTDEYFQNKINLSIEKVDNSILEAILKESPSKEIISLINQAKENNYESQLKIEINNFVNITLENYIFLKSKYSLQTNQTKIIFANLKIAVEKRELQNITQNSNLIRLIELKKISDVNFLKQLESIKPQVELKVHNQIKKDYDFKRLSSLIKLEDENGKRKLLIIQKELEEKFIGEMSYTKNLKILDEKLNYVSSVTKNKLTAIKSQIIQENNKIKFDKSIRDIVWFINSGSFNEAINEINKNYPNTFAENSSENNLLKGFLATARNEMEKEEIAKRHRQKVENDAIVKQKNQDNEIANAIADEFKKALQTMKEGYFGEWKKNPSKCYFCKGKGSVSVCPRCDEKGKILCRVCNGKRGFNDGTVCKSCLGTGIQECDGCNGKIYNVKCQHNLHQFRK